MVRPELLASVFAAIVNAQEAQLHSPKISIVKHLRREFCSEGWICNVPIFQSKLHAHHFGLFKARVAIEIEFSRYEFVYRDFIRFLAAYNADKIDVGVLITNTREGLNRIKCKSSGPSFERVCEELDWLRPALTVPLWIIGLR